MNEPARRRTPLAGGSDASGADTIPPGEDTFPNSSDVGPVRLRVFFRKGESVKYISHLDMLRAWERAIRRSGLPLAYSQGYSPHPKITIAVPLAVGFTGEKEVLDIILNEPVSGQKVMRVLAPMMPPRPGQAGLSVVSAERVELDSPTLTTLLHQAVYDILLVDIAECEARRRVKDLLQQQKVPVEFRRKRFDLRPLIESLKVREVHPPDAVYPPDKLHPALVLRAVMLRDERGRIGRPDVLLQALDLSEHVRQVHRVRMVFEA